MQVPPKPFYAGLKTVSPHKQRRLIKAGLGAVALAISLLFAHQASSAPAVSARTVSPASDAPISLLDGRTLPPQTSHLNPSDPVPGIPSSSIATVDVCDENAARLAVMGEDVVALRFMVSELKPEDQEYWGKRVGELAQQRHILAIEAKSCAFHGLKSGDVASAYGIATTDANLTPNSSNALQAALSTLEERFDDTYTALSDIRAVSLIESDAAQHPMVR